MRMTTLSERLSTKNSWLTVAALSICVLASHRVGRRAIFADHGECTSCKGAGPRSSPGKEGQTRGRGLRNDHKGQGQTHQEGDRGCTSTKQVHTCVRLRRNDDIWTQGAAVGHFRGGGCRAYPGALLPSGSSERSCLLQEPNQKQQKKKRKRKKASVAVEEEDEEDAADGKSCVVVVDGAGPGGPR